jgi:hypothetical protein
MKGSGWFLKPPPSSFVPFTFPFLSQLSVCLCVSRVRVYLTTNQQHGIPCLFKRGPLPDWPVWTRAQMEGGASACGEGSAEEKGKEEPPRVARNHRAILENSKAIKKRWEGHAARCEDEGFSGRRSPESAPLDESAPALRPTIMAEKPGDDGFPENKGRAPLPKIMAARSGEPEPSLEEKVRQIRVTMSARAETISVLGIGAPTTQVESPPGAGKASAESEAQHGRRTPPNHSVPAQEK